MTSILATDPALDAADAVSRSSSPAPESKGGRLAVNRLSVGFRRGDRVKQVVRDVSFTLEPGQCLAIVGESGSGKSVTARTIVGLTGRDAVVESEGILLDGDDLSRASTRQWRTVRGRRIGFILQDALVSLDPLRPVGREIDEALRLHGHGTRAKRAARVVELLASVGVPNPEVRARQRPGELSGGLRQRALIASALALDPEIIIADEPTTALDVTVQAQVLALLEETKSRGVSIVLISHDLSVVAQLADQILVMRGGHVVESGSAEQVLGAPQHEYTRALIAAVPGGHTRDQRLSPTAVEGGRVRPVEPVARDARPTGTVLEAVDLVKRFPSPGGGTTTAVDHVSFRLEAGTTLGIVGESGSGKSTTARLALALAPLDGGRVTLLGQEWSSVDEQKRRALRRQISMVSQDPLSSFDPRWNAERILLDSLTGARRATLTEKKDRVRELAGQVGLPEELLQRFPLQLSGGQRQRIAIARALAPDPAVVVLDEAVSALDVSIQAQILDLLVDLQNERGLSYLFISHDLGVISHMSDQVLVMKDGVVVERGTPDDIFERPEHPYTRQLVSSLQTLDSHTRRTS